MINHKILSEKNPDKLYQFSLCTICNNLEEYEVMKRSFELCGFDTNCEYLMADNSKQNVFNAYEAVRNFLMESNATFIIIVHQDVRCLDHKAHLIKCLEQLSAIDPDWAICGNGGAIGYHQFIMHIDNDGVILKSHNLPTRVTSLDENFLIIKASSNITVSNNFTDFHLYGTDLCLIADILGYNCYVIPFMVKHLSHGNQKQLLKHVNNFIENYGEKLRSRHIQTTCTKFYLSNSKIKNRFYNSPLIFFFIKFFQKIKYKIRLIRYGRQHKREKIFYDKQSF